MFDYISRLEIIAYIHMIFGLRRLDYGPVYS